ncbi:MAG: hypothetical protein AAFX99_05785 [Myxococcota bacterium]
MFPQPNPNEGRALAGAVGHLRLGDVHQHPYMTLPVVVVVVVVGLWLATCLGCAGSNGATPHPPTQPTDMTGDKTVSPEVRATLQTACDDLLASHRKVVEGSGINDPKRRDRMVKAATCQVMGRGAWASIAHTLTATPAQDNPEPNQQNLKGTWHIVHIQADGTRSVLSPSSYARLFSGDIALDPTPSASNYEVGLYHSDSLNLQLFDFDADQNPEALVTYGFSGHESSSMGRTKILAFVPAQGIAFYGPTVRLGALEQVADLNGDQRPDLILASPYSIGEPNTMDGTFEGPEFVAISRADGSFDMNAPAAVLHMRGQCIQWLRNNTTGYLDLLTFADGDLDNELFRVVLWNVACARIFGVDKATIRQNLETNALKRNVSEGFRFEDTLAYDWADMEPITTFKR